MLEQQFLATDSAIERLPQPTAAMELSGSTRERKNGIFSLVGSLRLVFEMKNHRNTKRRQRDLRLCYIHVKQHSVLVTRCIIYTTSSVSSLAGR